MKVIKVICTLFIFGFVSVSHAAVIFITEKDANGTVTSLLGADNVEVNGLFYNVRFLDGTCIALFNGCDDRTDFVFNTVDTATAASEALLAQVFVNGIMGNFDSSPWLTSGCGGFDVCITATPYTEGAQGGFGFVGATNWINPITDKTVSSIWDAGEMLDSKYFRVSGSSFAVWSDAIEVSAPGTAMILLMGIAGLLVSQRRKQA
jgi:hypothetical protein